MKKAEPGVTAQRRMGKRAHRFGALTAIGFGTALVFWRGHRSPADRSQTVSLSTKLLRRARRLLRERHSHATWG